MTNTLKSNTDNVDKKTNLNTTHHIDIMNKEMEFNTKTYKMEIDLLKNHIEFLKREHKWELDFKMNEMKEKNEKLKKENEKLKEERFEWKHYTEKEEEGNYKVKACFHIPIIQTIELNEEEREDVDEIYCKNNKVYVAFHTLQNKEFTIENMKEKLMNEIWVIENYEEDANKVFLTDLDGRVEEEYSIYEDIY